MTMRLVNFWLPTSMGSKAVLMEGLLWVVRKLLIRTTSWSRDAFLSRATFLVGPGMLGTSCSRGGGGEGRRGAHAEAGAQRPPSGIEAAHAMHGRTRRGRRATQVHPEHRRRISVPTQHRSGQDLPQDHHGCSVVTVDAGSVA